MVPRLTIVKLLLASETALPPLRTVFNCLLPTMRGARKCQFKRQEVFRSCEASEREAALWRPIFSANREKAAVLRLLRARTTRSGGVANFQRRRGSPRGSSL